MKNRINYVELEIISRGDIGLCTNGVIVGRSRDRSPVVSLGIFSEATDGTMCPVVDSASKNEYQENSWE
jgi:hypothetical protein